MGLQMASNLIGGGAMDGKHVRIKALLQEDIMW